MQYPVANTFVFSDCSKIIEIQQNNLTLSAMKCSYKQAPVEINNTCIAVQLTFKTNFSIKEFNKCQQCNNEYSFMWSFTCELKKYDINRKMLS